MRTRPPVTPGRNTLGPAVCGRALEVEVDDRGLDRAIRALKRKVAGEGVTKALKQGRHYEKPSVRKRRKQRDAERRRRRAARRSIQVDRGPRRAR